MHNSFSSSQARPLSTCVYLPVQCVYLSRAGPGCPTADMHGARLPNSVSGNGSLVWRGLLMSGIISEILITNPRAKDRISENAAVDRGPRRSDCLPSMESIRIIIIIGLLRPSSGMCRCLAIAGIFFFPSRLKLLFPFYARPTSGSGHDLPVVQE